MTTKTYKEVGTDDFLYCEAAHAIACRAVLSVEKNEDGSVCANGTFTAHGEDFVDSRGIFFSDVFKAAENIKSHLRDEIARYEAYIERLNRDIAELRRNSQTQGGLNFKDLGVGNVLFRGGLLSDDKAILSKAIDTVETVDGRLYINGLFIRYRHSPDVEIRQGLHIFSDAYKLHQHMVDCCNQTIMYLKGKIDSCERDAWGVYRNGGKPIVVSKSNRTNEIWEW